MVAVLDAAGARLESVRYAGYGMPTLLPDGDYDQDGDVDTDDSYAFLDDHANAEPRADMTWDGIKETDDEALFEMLAETGAASPIGYGTLSQYALRKGYAGYENDGTIVKLAHVRHRVLDSELGRWTRRDPAGYVDGESVLQYVRSRPVTRADPSGLATWGDDDATPESPSLGIPNLNPWRDPYSDPSLNPTPAPAAPPTPAGPIGSLSCRAQARLYLQNNPTITPTCAGMHQSAFLSCCQGGGTYAACSIAASAVVCVRAPIIFLTVVGCRIGCTLRKSADEITCQTAYDTCQRPCFFSPCYTTCQNALNSCMAQATRDWLACDDQCINNTTPGGPSIPGVPDPVTPPGLPLPTPVVPVPPMPVTPAWPLPGWVPWGPRTIPPTSIPPYLNPRRYV